ncbi:uncharacterized protein MYCGRDRAFT_104117 [Zymoseptoria tritici IPO323]|uniref:Uncharacterized protein n=1 Tax=Zymoseptoria tritici (strain CBS 115943 / IPO323) TaxID=336722 RepID=F9X8Z2_ZYMTI|nr:uncharacterized protein MYCGRDRAFT_104117 [Zymoseptoria tritici IPO323]EGP87921.1 hypothetical protein MYCGRDRAFT_104117 [Zymoseptoria tritici IPO323]
MHTPTLRYTTRTCILTPTSRHAAIKYHIRYKRIASSNWTGLISCPACCTATQAGHDWSSSTLAHIRRCAPPSSILQSGGPPRHYRVDHDAHVLCRTKDADLSPTPLNTAARPAPWGTFFFPLYVLSLYPEPTNLEWETKEFLCT